MVFLTLDQFVLIHRLRWKSEYQLLIIHFGDESASELFITDICTCSRDGVDVLQIIMWLTILLFSNNIKLSYRLWYMCKDILINIDGTLHFDILKSFQMLQLTQNMIRVTQYMIRFSNNINLLYKKLHIFIEPLCKCALRKFAVSFVLTTNTLICYEFSRTLMV
eukprot:95217_1